MPPMTETSAPYRSDEDGLRVCLKITPRAAHNRLTGNPDALITRLEEWEKSQND